MVSIRDYTDTVLCKKMNIQNEEDVGRIETINNDMKIVINKNTLTINKAANQGNDDGPTVPRAKVD